MKKKLRDLAFVCKEHIARGGLGDAHPRTTTALNALLCALAAEFPYLRAPRQRMPLMARYRKQIRRLKRQVTKLNAELQRHVSTKTVGGRVSQEWLTRVFLAAPHASARALAHSFRAVAGTDESTVSRAAISKIKDAWIEMYKEMSFTSARGLVGTHLASAKGPDAVRAFQLVHVQDEADIRLRSSEAREGPSVPRRGRASKVQSHVVTLVAGGQRREIPTELDALGDKTAPTLATSLEAILRRVVVGVLPQSSAHCSSAREEEVEVWMMHILIGDGIPTNLAAAKLMWASVAERPLGSRVRYFLLVVKCATHQAALTAKAAVTGSFANAAGGELYKSMCGTAVRLFKYLVNDYYEEFCSTARDWVSTQLRVLAHGNGARQLATGLQDLYTAHVIPDEMLSLWNCGLGSLSHVLDEGKDPAEQRATLVWRFSQFLIGTLLKVDSRPTLTRFFTFRENIDRMLAMHLIGAPSRVIKLVSTKPREENKKRLTLVHGFFSHAEAAQTLRRASLALQLSGGVEALTARRTVHSEEPMIVRLSKGAAQDLVVQRLRRLFAALHQGPVLDSAAATCVLLLTAADLVVRFNVFLSYPFKLCRMCRLWFPATRCQNISEFLHEAADNLDVGVGLVLQQLAWAQGSEVLALGWLSSAPIQGPLQQLCEEALSTSLDVERQLGQVKQWEMSKSTNIATASRNMIVVRFSEIWSSWWQRSLRRRVGCGEPGDLIARRWRGKLIRSRLQSGGVGPQRTSPLARRTQSAHGVRPRRNSA